MSRRILAAFDFDFTLVDNDSDHFVFDKLSPELRRKMSELHGVVQWTDLMHQLLGELHQEGKTKQQIIDALGTIEFNPAILKMFEAIKSVGGEIIIVSDANTIYIDEILKAKNAREYITEIITNPGTWDETGRLHVTRRIKPPQTHNCPGVCSVNLCKGSEMLARIENYDMVLYGGDGRNDHCPMTKLKANRDIAFARKGHSLEKLLNSDQKHVEAIQARLVWWTEADDLLEEVVAALAGKA
ncbi:phosphatase phospho-type [Obelidium mucronatum]|nr:phosphatase phospho-type [Obelidium mucronatum]